MHPASHSWASLHLRFGWNGRQIAIGPGGTLAILGLVTAAALWSLIAGFYVCFHDSLLASLMTRQSDMQYAYEDQIATLRTELDRESSRNLIDRHTIDTTLHDLAARSGQLETHAATIDRLISDGATGSTRDRRLPNTGASRSYEPAVAPRLRLEDATDGGHASLEPDAVSARLAAIEDAQLNAVTQLRDPLVRETRRLSAALNDTGLRRFRGGPSHEGLARDVGGPFVPLEASVANDRSFDVQVALLKDALAQRARLAAVVDHVPLHVPLDGPLEVSSTFGPRIDPFLGRAALHTGIDLRETAGDAVHATGEGVVTVAGPSGGYGNMVEIDHGGGIVTRYAHLSQIDVGVHQRVATGAIVGHVGSTGRATGPHLHYETRIDGEPVDPATFLMAASRLASE